MNFVATIACAILIGCLPVRGMMINDVDVTTATPGLVVAGSLSSPTSLTFSELPRNAWLTLTGGHMDAGGALEITLSSDYWVTFVYGNSERRIFGRTIHQRSYRTITS